MTPKIILQIVSEYTSTSIQKIKMPLPESQRSRELCAFLILAYCHQSETSDKCDALNVTETDLLYLKSECWRRSKKFANIKKEIDDLRDHIENVWGGVDWDKVDYSQKSTVVYYCKHKANYMRNSKGKLTHLADASLKYLPKKRRLETPVII